MFPGFALLLGFVSVVIAPAPLGCTWGSRKFNLGERYNDGSGQCVTNECTEGGKWSQITCGLVGVPDKWVFRAGDPSKLYPDCCGSAVPPLNITPDVVDKVLTTVTLQVIYAGVQVDLGNELTTTQVKSEPDVFYEMDPDSYYLICLTDPDAPSRQAPTNREFHHWLVGNLDSSEYMPKGDVLTEYRGPSPPQGTGLHRYVFLMYKQPGKLKFTEAHIKTTQTEERKHFSIRNFAAKYNLGLPVAVNVFQAQALKP